MEFPIPSERHLGTAQDPELKLQQRPDPKLPYNFNKNFQHQKRGTTLSTAILWGEYAIELGNNDWDMVEKARTKIKLSSKVWLSLQPLRCQMSHWKHSKQIIRTEHRIKDRMLKNHKSQFHKTYSSWTSLYHYLNYWLSWTIAKHKYFTHLANIRDP